MDPTLQLDAAGRRRSPATLPGYHSPRNKGCRYPDDPPRVEEIVAVMRQAGARPAGLRLRGLIVVLWRCPECDPAPTRPCGPRDHLGLSTGDREWRDR